MADPKGFLKYDRTLPETRPVRDRLRDYDELYQDAPVEQPIQQAARCMDCGVPFCHNGCPLGNIIPEFNDAVHEEDWEEAYQILSSTNNFPEFTGRICPAPCEAACVLGINQPPVAIEYIEKSIAEKAFENGYIKPNPPIIRSGKRIAVIGSGPAGLATAAQLNKAGHTITIYERSDRIGGLLRYGIPDFKLSKQIIDRRINIMKAEGIQFITNYEVGITAPASDLIGQYDAIVLCGGATKPRNLNLPGRSLKGIHFAMEFLEVNNKKVAGDEIPELDFISAKDKHVVVIGGGDTGADCVGTSNRHGAASVTQIELLAKPPAERDAYTWPNWPMVLRTSTSHEEGCDRRWAMLTKSFIGKEDTIEAIELVDIEWKLDPESGKHHFSEIEGTSRTIPCDLALLAIGFLGPEKKGLLEQLGVELDQWGNVRAENYQTNIHNIFVAGDMRRGQSLVVWAISEGREAAKAIDEYLMGSSLLETKDDSYLNV